MATLPLTGYKYKQEQQAAADLAKKTADAADKTKKDREYDLRKAQDNAATTAIAAGGAAACSDAALVERQAVTRLTGEMSGLAGGAARPYKQQIGVATRKAELLESLAAKDDPGRLEAIAEANQAVVEAQEALRLAGEEAT